jgi:recombination protein RecT
MNAPETQVRNSCESLFDELERQKLQIAAYLPAGANLDRFLALARQAVAQDRRLLECSTSSVMRAIGACAASGLPLDGKFSSLIVRNSKTGTPTASWDPSYRGMVTLALFSGQVKDVQGNIVREHDHFEFELGTEPKLIHRPCLLPKYGDVIAAYAIAKLSSGGQMIEILLREDIAKIRAMSAAAKGPWSQWSDEMAKKSAIRRLLKRLPAGTVRGFDPLPPASAAAFAPQLPEDSTELESRAIAAIAATESSAELEHVWQGIVAEFRVARVDLPLSIEARTHDRREALSQ